MPPFHNVNPNLLVQSSATGEVTVNHFVPDQDDLVVRCPSDLHSVLQARCRSAADTATGFVYPRVPGTGLYADARGPESRTRRRPWAARRQRSADAPPGTGVAAGAETSTTDKPGSPRSITQVFKPWTARP